MSTQQRVAAGRPTGGQFAGTDRTEADIALEASGFYDITPELAQSPTFSVDALERALGQTLTYDDVRTLADGTEEMTFTYPAYNAPDAPLRRIAFDERGNITRIDDWAHGLGRFHDYGLGHEAFQTEQEHIDRARLIAAGIKVGDHPDNDGGHYGLRQVGEKREENLYDVAEIARRLRVDLARAQEYGALPADLSFSVRSDKKGTNAVRVAVDGIPDSLGRVDDPQYGGQVTSNYSRRISRTVQTIVDQWNDQEIDSQTDYFNVRYWGQVSILDDHHRAWTAREKERQQQAKSARAAA